jgi:hypothetical protein
MPDASFSVIWCCVLCAEWPWEGMGVRGRVECARWYCRLGQTDDARKVAADLGMYIVNYMLLVHVCILIEASISYSESHGFL